MRSYEVVVRDIGKIFTQGDASITVLSGISYHFFSGETYGLTGVSGAGKSTLLSIIAGLERPTQGSVWYNGQDITAMAEAERQRLVSSRVGLMFQYPFLIRELTVLENVALKAQIEQLDHPQERAYALLEKVGLADKAHALPGGLSGGEQQRVACARALVHEPVFLFADEPTAHLDEQNRERILALFDEMYAKTGMGIVVSSHDRAVVGRMHKIIRLEYGQVVE